MFAYELQKTSEPAEGGTYTDRIILTHENHYAQEAFWQMVLEVAPDAFRQYEKNDGGSGYGKFYWGFLMDSVADQLVERFGFELLKPVAIVEPADQGMYTPGVYDSRRTNPTQEDEYLYELADRLVEAGCIVPEKRKAYDEMTPMERATHDLNGMYLDSMLRHLSPTDRVRRAQAQAGPSSTIVADLQGNILSVTDETPFGGV